MAGQVLAVASLKGGCGKSTLAWNLAAGLARREGLGQVGVLDADPQGALTHWGAWGAAGGTATATVEPTVAPSAVAPPMTCAASRWMRPKPAASTSTEEPFSDKTRAGRKFMVPMKSATLRLFGRR